MKKVGYILILVGGALGPGYFIWATFFSGREVASSTIFTQEAAAARVGRVRAAVRGGGEWSEPFEVRLGPEMGRIAVIGVAEAFAVPRRRRTFSVVVTADSDRGELWTESVGFTSGRSSSSDESEVQRTTIRKRVRVFRVSEPGPVRFRFEQGEHARLPVTSVSLSVRAGTHAPRLPIWGAGVLVLLLGFGWLFVAERREG